MGLKREVELKQNFDRIHAALKVFDGLCKREILVAGSVL